MGTVHALKPAPAVTLAEASGAYVTHLRRGGKSAGTQEKYGYALQRLGRSHPDLAAITPAMLGDWMEAQFGGRAPATHNLAVTILRSAWAWWGEQGWADPSVPLSLPWRHSPENRTRAMPAADVECMLAGKDAPLRDRLLWTMLFETAARASEILRLDVPGLDLSARSAAVTRKAGARDRVAWMTRTAILLPRYLKGRTAGPVFLTSVRARGPLADIAPDGRGRLSYRQAADIFSEASWRVLGHCCSLHGLRHAALQQAADQGASVSQLMALSGHASRRSLEPYISRMSPDAFADWQAQRDPARRR